MYGLARSPGTASFRSTALKPSVLKPLVVSEFRRPKTQRMAWRCGSLSRSLISTARASTVRSNSSLSRLRPPTPPLQGHRLQSNCLLSSVPRAVGVLGCTQSLLPLYSVVASTRLTSRIAVEARACCELSHGT